ncbi:hypothetical protein [Labrenzia sp. DG1229]|uniref:hypothetical protein n=1 Tax=Labrenzia sp. DG1229 TaxID=681847 RepID=UPI00048CC4EB|nr:hypothetical protein [Labrenzia sp. DG1229]
MRTFSVKNFDKFQHYKDRNPPWIKLYNELLDDYEFGCLPDISKWHLIAIWLLASRSGNRIPMDARWVAKRINANDEPDLQVLFDFGFLIENQELRNVEQDASKPLAFARSRETETEGETEAETRGENVDEVQPSKPKYPSSEEQFEEWYADYPHKVGRGAALKAFKTVIKKTDLETLKTGLQQYVLTKPADRSWCNPATWLNQERWADQPAPDVGGNENSKAQTPNAQDTIQLLNHNHASRAAVVSKLERWFSGQAAEWRYTPAWSDDHPPEHPGCVIPQDIVNEVRERMGVNDGLDKGAA